jgi:hypothetical protein
MKQAIAFFAIVFTLSFGACSSHKSGTEKVNLTACSPCGSGGKIVLLQANSYEEGGRVVRLAPR